MNQSKWCTTAYLTEYRHFPANIICLIVLNVVVAVLNILINGFLIYALRKTQQLKNLSNQFIACLSLSDCGVGLLAQPLIIATLWNKHMGVISCNTEMATQAVGFTFCHFSGVMLAIIAVDRHLHIKYKNKYNFYMNSSRAIKVVALNLFIALIVAGGSVLSSTQHTYITFDQAMMSIDTIVVLFIWLNYILIFRLIKEHMRTIHRKDSEGNTQVLSKVKADAAFAKTMVLIMTSQAICYFPYFLSSSLRSKKDVVHRESWLGSFRWWSLLLVYLCSSLNALIFIFRNAKIKRHFFRQFSMTTELNSSNQE
ncbi:adenosine receptor A2b-like [Rhopilema esculentum]|uniref:adenosine receptor A2b-like n=1 Tax=Rhopilema esculentum TaxID=499914 RepID=UPI0031CF1672